MAVCGAGSLAAMLMWAWVYGMGSLTRLVREHEKYVAAHASRDVVVSSLAVEGEQAMKEEPSRQERERTKEEARLG